MTVQNYSHKSEAYFGRARKDILPLFPVGGVQKVLEVGCGNGATLAYLKQQGLVQEVHGMELMEAVAAQAQPVLDALYVGDAVALVATLPNDTYDAVLCLDVLEHLVDPWSFVLQLERVLKPGGCLIASIPNLRTFPVLWNLGVGGRFDYAQQGIMDKTHVRFFTQKTALALVETPLLRRVDWRRSPMAPWSKSKIVNALTLGLFRDLFTEQYLVKSVKTNP